METTAPGEVFDHDLEVIRWWLEPMGLLDVEKKALPLRIFKWLVINQNLLREDVVGHLVAEQLDRAANIVLVLRENLTSGVANEVILLTNIQSNTCDDPFALS